ncbi:hypothetical protein [Hymenobacter gelipurpurascens]|nr:hypothetical protein [Hymenobacter gelipurpurascens]
MPCVPTYVPYGPYVLELEEQGHPKFFGLNSYNEPQVISLPLRQSSRLMSVGYHVSNDLGSFCLHRITLAVWVASLSISQLKKYYPRLFEGENSSNMALTPPDEFGVIMRPDAPWGQLHTNQADFSTELKKVATQSGVVITHNEEASSYGLYYRSKLVAQGPQLDVDHIIKLLTHHMNTTVAYHPVKQKVLDERYKGVFPVELENFENWDGEVQEHQQFPLANLFYVRVQAASEHAALHMAREEITQQRSLNPVRVASRGLPFEIESVTMLDRALDRGFYEVRYHFVSTTGHLRMASAS